VSSSPNSLGCILMATSVAFGLIPAIACLTIYYVNGGASARCSQPLPSWLFWMGYISAVNALLPMVTYFLVPSLWDGSRNNVQQLAKFLGGLLNMFLIIWFAIGCVGVFMTNQSLCNAGMYNATRIFVVVSLVFFPLVICCGCWVLYSVANDADRASEKELMRKRAASQPATL
jgi:hypothetical protein